MKLQHVSKQSSYFYCTMLKRATTSECRALKLLPVCLRFGNEVPYVYIRAMLTAYAGTGGGLKNKRNSSEHSHKGAWA